MGSSLLPIRCIERHPTTQTVKFLGCPINLTELAESYIPPLGHSHLSLIFSGKRQPSLEVARQIADALGMQLQAFLDGLEQAEQEREKGSNQLNI